MVANGRELIPSAGVADLEPGALLGISSGPLLRVPLADVLSDTPAPAPLRCDAGAHLFTDRGPGTAPLTDREPAPTTTTVTGSLQSPSTW